MRSVQEELRSHKQSKTRKEACESSKDKGPILVNWDESNHVLIAEGDSVYSASSGFADARSAASSGDTTQLRILVSEVSRTRHALERMEKQLSQRFQHRQVSGGDALWEWRCVAEVIDRLFFWIYCAVIVLSLVLFFPRPEDSLFPVP